MSEENSTRSLRAEIELLFKADETGSTLDKFKRDINETAEALTALDSKLNLQVLKKDIETLMESLGKKGKNTIHLAVTEFRDQLIKKINTAILTSHFEVKAARAKDKFIIDIEEETVKKLQEQFKNKIKTIFNNPQNLFPKTFERDFKLSFSANDVRKLSTAFNKALSEVLSNGVDFHTASLREVLKNGEVKMMPAKDLLKMTFDRKDLEHIMNKVKEKIVAHITDPKNVQLDSVIATEPIRLQIDSVDKVFEKLKEQIKIIKEVINGELKAVKSLENLNLEKGSIEGTAKSIVEDIKLLKHHIEQIKLSREKNSLSHEELTEGLQNLAKYVHQEVFGFIKGIVDKAKEFESEGVKFQQVDYKPYVSFIHELITKGIRGELESNIEALIKTFGYTFDRDDEGNVKLVKDLSKLSGKITSATIQIVEKIAQELNMVNVLDENEVGKISGFIEFIQQKIVEKFQLHTADFAEKTAPKLINSYKSILEFFDKELNNELAKLLRELQKTNASTKTLSEEEVKKLVEAINSMDFSKVEKQTEQLTKVVENFVKKLLTNIQNAIKGINDNAKNPLSKADIELIQKHIDNDSRNLVISAMINVKEALNAFQDNIKKSNFESLTKKDKDLINNSLKKSLSTMIVSMLSTAESVFTPLNLHDEIKKKVSSQFNKLAAKILSSIDFSSIDAAHAGTFSPEDIQKISAAGKEVAQEFAKNLKEAMQEHRRSALNSFKNNYKDVIKSITFGINTELQRIKDHLDAAEKSNNYSINIDFKPLFQRLSKLTIGADASDTNKIKSTLEYIRELLASKVKELIDSVVNSDQNKQPTDKEKQQLKTKLDQQTKKLLSYITSKSLFLIEEINSDLKKLGVKDFSKKDADTIKESFKNLAAKIVTGLSNTSQSLVSKVKLPKEVKDSIKVQLEEGIAESLKNVKLNLGNIDKIDLNLNEEAINSIIAGLSNITKLANQLNFSIGDNISILTSELDTTVKRVLAAKKGMSIKDYLKNNKVLSGEEGLREVLEATADPAGRELGNKFILAAKNYFTEIQTKIKSTEFTIDPLHGEGLIEFINKLMNNAFKVITDKIGKTLTAEMGGVMKQISNIDMSHISIDSSTLTSLINNSTPEGRTVRVNTKPQEHTGPTTVTRGEGLNNLLSPVIQSTSSEMENIMLEKQFQEEQLQMLSKIKERNDIDDVDFMEKLDKEIEDTAICVKRLTEELQRLKDGIMLIENFINGQVDADNFVKDLPSSLREKVINAMESSKYEEKEHWMNQGHQYKEMDTEPFSLATRWGKGEPGKTYKVGNLEIDHEGRVVYRDSTPTFDYDTITSMTRPNLLEMALRGKPKYLTPEKDEPLRDITLPDVFNRRPDGVSYTKLEGIYRSTEIFRQSMVNKYSQYATDDRAKNEAAAYLSEFDAVVPHLQDTITALYEALSRIPKGKEGNAKREAIKKQIEVAHAKLDLEFDRLRNLDELLIDRAQGIKAENTESKVMKDINDFLKLQQEKTKDFYNKHSMLLDDTETSNMAAEINEQMARLEALSRTNPKGSSQVMDTKNEFSDIKTQLKLITSRYTRIEREQNVANSKDKLIETINTDKELFAGLSDDERNNLVQQIKDANKKAQLDEIRNVISNARKAGRTAISKEEKFTERAEKKLDQVDFMGELEQVRAGEIIKQYENKLSSKSMEVVKSDLSSYLSEVSALKNTKLENENDLAELEKTITRLSEKMKLLKSKWNDMLHDENIFYGGTKARNQLQGMRQLRIIDTEQIDAVEKLINEAVTQNELKFAKDMVDDLKQQQTKAIQQAILQGRKDKLSEDKANLILSATEKGILLDKIKLDKITEATSEKGTKEDVSNAKALLAELLKFVAQTEYRKDKEKDLADKAGLFIEAKRILMSSLLQDSRRKLSTEQKNTSGFNEGYSLLVNELNRLEDILINLGEGKFNSGEIRELNTTMGIITNLYNQLRKKVDSIDKDNKAILKRDKLIQDIDILQQNEMIGENYANQLRRALISTDSIDDMSRIGLAVERQKADFKHMQELEKEGNATVINEQRRSIKAENLQLKIEKLQNSAREGLIEGTPEFSDFSQKISSLLAQLNTAKGMDVSTDFNNKLMGNKMQELNAVIDSLKEQLKKTVNSLKRGIEISRDPSLKNREVTVAEIIRAIQVGMPNAKVEGRVGIDNAKNTWFATVIDENGARMKLVGTIDKNMGALMQHSSTLERSAESIAASASRFNRLSVSDNSFKTNRIRNNNPDEVNSLSKFESSLVNTIRYMFAGTLIGYPSMLFYKGYDAYKEFENSVNKAQQNFLMKDPDMTVVAARRLQNAYNSGQDKEITANYNDPVKYNQMLEKEKADLKNKASGGYNEQLRNYAYVYGVSTAEAGKAFEIMSRRLDDPKETMAFTREVIKARSLEDVDIEEFSKGFEALAAQWGMTGANIERANNMMIKASNLTQSRIEDILLTESRAGAIFKDTSPNLLKEKDGLMKAFAQSVAMGSLFVQSTARTGKEGGTFFKSFLERVYSAPSRKALEDLQRNITGMPGMDGIDVRAFADDGSGVLKQRDAVDIYSNIVEANKRLNKESKQQLLKPFIAQWHTGSEAAVTAMINETGEILKREGEAIKKVNQERKKDNIEPYKAHGANGEFTAADVIRYYNDSTYKTNPKEIAMMTAVNMGTYKFKMNQMSTMFESVMAKFFESFSTRFSIFATRINGILRLLGDNSNGITQFLSVLSVYAKTLGAKYLMGYIADKRYEARAGKDAEKFDNLAENYNRQATVLNARREAVNSQIQDAYDKGGEEAKNQKIQELMPEMAVIQAESEQLNNRTKLMENHANELGIDQNHRKIITEQVPIGFENAEVSHEEYNRAVQTLAQNAGMTGDEVSSIIEEMNRLTAEFKNGDAAVEKYVQCLKDLTQNLGLSKNEEVSLQMGISGLNSKFKSGEISLKEYRTELKQLFTDMGFEDREANKLTQDIMKLNKEFQKGAMTAKDYEKAMNNLAKRLNAARANINFNDANGNPIPVNPQTLPMLLARQAQEEAGGAANSNVSPSDFINVGQEEGTILRRGIAERFSDMGQIGGLAGVAALFGGRYVKDSQGNILKDREGKPIRTAEIAKELGDEKAKLSSRLFKGAGNFIKENAVGFLASQAMTAATNLGARAGNTQAENDEADALAGKRINNNVNTLVDDFSTLNPLRWAKGILDFGGLFVNVVEDAFTNMGGGLASNADTMLGGKSFDEKIQDARMDQQLEAFKKDPNKPYYYTPDGQIDTKYTRYNQVTTLQEAQELVQAEQQRTAMKSESVTANFDRNKFKKLISGVREDSEEMYNLNKQMIEQQKKIVEDYITYLKGELKKIIDSGQDPNGDSATYFKTQIDQQQAKIEQMNYQDKQDAYQVKLSAVGRISDTLNFNRQVSDIDFQNKMNKYLLAGGDSEDFNYKAMEKEALKAQNATISAYLPQLKASLNGLKDPQHIEQYRQTLLEIKQLEAEQVTNLVKIKDTLEGNKSTFNLPSGMNVMTYYEAVTEKGTHKNMSILKGDTVINITVQGNVDSQKTIDKIAQAVDRSVQTDAVARGLANTVNRRVATNTSVR